MRVARWGWGAIHFLSPRVSEAHILAGCFQATRERFAASEGTILVLQDTIELTFQRERPEAVGITDRVNSGKDKAGWTRMQRSAVASAALSRTPRSRRPGTGRGTAEPVKRHRTGRHAVEG